MTYNNCSPTENSPCTPCSTECKDIYSSNCVKYVGTTETCTGLTVTTNDYLTTIIQDLVTKICELETRLAALE